jgi:hypothetical protein
MTTPNMNLDCDGFANALADYLEGDVTDAVRLAVEAHASACAACESLLADLNGIRAGASALPQLAPSRDLWSGIAERIDAPVIPMVAPRVQKTVVRTWLRPALAAAALVVITAGITNYLTRATMSVPATQQVAATISRPEPSASLEGKLREGPALAEPTAEIKSTNTESPTPVVSVRIGSAPNATRPAAARLVSTAVDIGEPVLENEIRSLRRIVNERRSQLDPKTIAVLEQSVAVIDAAIAQSRAALAKDPASGFLATQLNRSLEKKVELLRTATLLPAGT